jgi:hypothetical protein
MAVFVVAHQHHSPLETTTPLPPPPQEDNVADVKGAGEGKAPRRWNVMRKYSESKKEKGIYLLLLVFYSYLAAVQCVRCCE